MKKLLFFSLIMLSLAFVGFSQTIPPPYINYQAVLYDVNSANPNTPLTNQSFTTFVNINDELGNLLYREEHYASTDANGQITVKIGDGVYLQGTITNFNQINWGTGKYYLIVDFDINGTISSTAPEQLVTVPYTFYAGKAGNGMTAVADNGNGTLTFTYANGQTYITPTLSGIQGPIGPAGPQGPQGVPGLQGANGLNALIKTTTELAGANCTNGGTKIETGLDANANGVLEAGEVNASQTKYVCDGLSSTNHFINSLPQSVAFSSNTSWVCPSGIDTIQLEIYGASGGGGGGAFSINATGCVGSGKGGNGGKGGYFLGLVAVQPGNSYSINIGAGGTAGVSGSITCVGVSNGGSGGNAGTTSFNNQISVSGGTGGQGGACSYVAQNGIDGPVTNYVTGQSNFTSSSYPTSFTNYLYGVYNRPITLLGGNGNNGNLNPGLCNACNNCYPGIAGNKGLIIIRY